MKTKIIKTIVPIVCILLIMLGIGYTLCQSPRLLRSEYSTKFSVDSPDKIANTISNAVYDLEKRDFVPVNLKVWWHPTSKTYSICIGGIDRAKLGKYEP